MTTGSILDRAVDVGSLGSRYLKVCFYGENGRGKTTLLSQFPKPLLLFSFEPTRSGGPNSIVNVPGVKVLRWGTAIEVHKGEAEFTTMAEAVGVANDLRDNDARGFASVGLDGATGVQRLVTAEMLREVGRHVPEVFGFGTLTDDQNKTRPERVKQCLVPFLEIPAHVIVTAKEKDFNPPKDYNDKGKLIVDMRPREIREPGSKSWIAPEVSASTESWLKDACGYLFRMYLAPETVSVPNPMDATQTQEVETGRYEVRLRLKPHANYATRGAFPNPERVPESIGGGAADLYRQLMDVINGK